jgi:hypothetical protein
MSDHRKECEHAEYGVCTCDAVDLAAIRTRLERAEELLLRWRRCEAYPGTVAAALDCETAAFLAPTPPEPPRDQTIGPYGDRTDEAAGIVRGWPIEVLKDPGRTAAVPLKEPTCGTCGGDGMTPTASWDDRCPACGGTGSRTPEVTR